ncbi:MAG: type II secretion system minor pseudopilin GspK [Desulfobulbales bacterium]|nr:type II secretion system minor pseudopilin GspK [Desulfobulbales bacterium]
MKKSMFDILNNNRGMALLMTVLIISLILVITLRFNISTRASLTSASNLQDNVALDYMAKSILNASRAILSVDAAESSFDSLHEDWANLAAASQYFAYFFSRGQGGMNIVDHSGRLQVNSLLTKKDDEWIVNEEQKKVWINLLSAEEFDLTDEEVNAIIEAVVDWIDEDDDEQPGFGGAESSFYQGLEVPYTPRNGPLEFVEELLLIRGITPELYYGDEEIPGLEVLVTPHGRDGKININTAEPLILSALSDQIEPDMVDSILTYRDYEDSDLTNPDWYKWAPGFPGDIEIPPELITTKSSFFEINTEVVVEKMRKKVRGMVARGQGSTTELIYWKIE